MHAFYELLFVLNHSPERLKIREILVEKGLIEQSSALATMYESKKIAADPRQSRYGYVCIYTHNFDEADDYEDAVEDSNLVDLEASWAYWSFIKFLPCRIYLDSGVAITFFKTVVVQSYQ